MNRLNHAAARWRDWMTQHWWRRALFIAFDVALIVLIVWGSEARAVRYLA